MIDDMVRLSLPHAVNVGTIVRFLFLEEILHIFVYVI